ncbi:MAG: DMT family transporter [Nitrospirota bacterium]|jgi:drug/metabolite transporter (DMT)-like permease
MKTIALVLVASLCAAIGETILSYGMKRIGQPEMLSVGKVLGWLLTVVTNPYVLLGTAFGATFFLLYLTALSRADLSFVMPLTAASFIFAAALARFILSEQISWWRWVGTLVIVLGIAVVSMDGKQRTWQGQKENVSGEKTTVGASKGEAIAAPRGLGASEEES